MPDALDLAIAHVRDTAPEPATQPQEPADPLDVAIQHVHAQKEQESSFASYLHEADKQTPDQAFEVLHLSAASGLAPQHVAQNLDQVRKQVDAGKLREELLQNPVLRSYLQDPSKLRVLSKDWQNASWLTKYVTGQFMHGVKQVTYGLLSGAAAAGRPIQSDLIPNELGFPGRDESALGEPMPPDDFSNLDTLEAAAEVDPTPGMGPLAKAATAPLRIAPYAMGALTARVLGGAAGTAAAGPAGLAAGQYAGGAAFDIIQIAGPVYRRLARLKNADGNPLLSDDQAKSIAWGFAVPAGAATALLAGAAPTVKAAVAATTEQAITKALAQVTAQQLAGRAAMHLAKDVGVGIVAMTTQAVMSHAAVEQGKFVGGQKPDYSQLPDIMVETAKSALIDLGGLALMGAGHRFFSDHAMLVRSQQSKALATALSDTALSSEAVQKFPQQVQELIAKARQEKGAVQNAHYDLEAWDRHWQGQSLDPGKVAASVVGDGGAAYAEAKATGELRIPIDKWVAKIAGSEHSAPLSEDLKLYQDALTPRQEKEFTKTQEALAKQAEQAEPEAAAALYKDFYAQAKLALEKTKVPQKRRDAVADANAQMYSSIVKTIAAREGWSIDEAKQRLGVVQVVAGAQPDAGALAQAAFHGSPHLFEKFSMQKIGSGEGAQVYGHGLYFAENPEVAKFYKDSLATGERIGTAKDFRLAIAKRLHERADAMEKAGGPDVAAQARSDARFMERLAGDVDESKASAISDAGLAQALANKHKIAVGDLIKEGGGAVYRVDVPENNRLLDYDRPLSLQPDTVKRVVADLLPDVKIVPIGETLSDIRVGGSSIGSFTHDRAAQLVANGGWVDHVPWTGGTFYRVLVNHFEALGRNDPQKAASEALRNAGIPGLRYLDEGSRAKGAGTHNFVIWDENEIRVLDRLFQPLTDAKGKAVDVDGAPLAYDSARGFISIGGQSEAPKWWPKNQPWEGGPRFSIHLLENADESTLAHETSHFFGEALGHLAQLPDASEALKRDYRILLEAMGHDTHEDRLAATQERRAIDALKIRTAEQDDRLQELRGREEALANLWEQYLAEGKAPTEALKGVFGRFKRWMKSIYRAIPTIATQFKDTYGRDLELSDDVRGVFDRVLGTDEEIAAFKRPEDKPAQPSFDDILAQLPDGSEQKVQLKARAEALNRRAIKELAAKAISDTPLAQLDPRYYLLAAQKARDASRKEGLKPEEQFAAREQQYLSESLYRAARAAKAESETLRARLQRYTRDDHRAELGKAIVKNPDGTVGQPYLERVDEMLSHFELGGYVSRAEVGRRLLTADWIASEQAAGRDPIVPDSVLRNLDRQVHWRDLTLGELRDLNDAVESVAHQAELKRTVLDRGKRRDRDQAKQELVETLFKNFKVRDLVAQESSLAGMLAARRTLRTLGYGLVRAENLIREMDGGKVDGPWARLIFDPVSDGTNEWYRLTREAGEAVRKVIDAMPTQDLERWRSYRFRVNGQEYTLEAAVAVALNWGSDSNRAKALKGWQHPSVEKRGIQPWTQETPLEFLKHLRKSDWNVVESIGKALAGQWQPSAELEKRVTGLAPEKVKLRPFSIETADGQVHESQGYYYPMIYDPRFPGAGRRGDEAAQLGGIKLFDPSYARALTPQGRLAGRVEGYARPISLEVLNKLPRKVSEASKDIGMREALLSAHGLLTDDDVSAAMQRTIGVEGEKMLLNAVRDAANDLVVPDNGSARWTDWMNKTRGGYIAAVFAYNAGQTLQNLTGMVPATRAVGGRWMARAIGELVSDRAARMAEIEAKSPYMREIRRSGSHAEVGEVLRSLQESKGLDKRFAEFGLQVFESTDRAVQFSTWLAAYRKATTQAEAGGLGMAEELAVRHADRTVRKDVMAGRTIDKPAIMRNKFARWFIPFYGWINNRANQMYSAVGDAQRSETAYQAAKIVGGTIAVLAAENLLSEVASGRGPKDENDDGSIDALDWAEWATRKTVLMPLGWIPLAKQYAQYLEDGRDINTVPEARAFTQSAKAIKGAGKLAYQAVVPGEQIDPDELLAEAQDIVESVGYWRGLPVAQGHRTVSHLKAVGEGDEQLDPLGLAFGKERPGSLRTALKE